MAKEENKELLKMFEAMESTEKLEKFIIAKNEVFTGKINTEKAEKFADYLTQRFLDSCNDKSVFGSFQNWDTKSALQRVSITEKILKAFIKYIKDDILNNKITVYVRDGSELKTDNLKAAQAYKEDIIQSIPEIEVKIKEDERYMMGVSREGVLYINPTTGFYNTKDALFFLMDLKHEFTHIVDMFIPAISPSIDPEILTDAQMFYVNPKRNFELYKNNPMELHANLHRKDLRIKIEQMLANQDTTIKQNSNSIHNER